jgi:hypothetical protein
LKRTSIGGPLDYAALARLHRPTEPAALQAEVRRLAASGLTAQDVATALRLDLVVVRTLLAATHQEAQAIRAGHADAARDARAQK